MRNKLLLSIAILGLSALSANAEILLDNKNNINTAISVYNNNLAFVRDVRNVSLATGVETIAFEGVASQIKPETAMLLSPSFTVLEQNYDYNLLTSINILNESVGSTVKTATTNPSNGQDIFAEAKILNATYGSAILEFAYGIDPNYNGRIIYEKLPENLRKKPTLQILVDNKIAEDKKLELAYLTNGISWKADYVADINRENVLNLNAWITITNESGADYKNASVQVIAGDVNQTQVAKPMPRMMMAKAMNFAADTVEQSASSLAANPVGDYYAYNIPNKTSIKDKQSKQLNLLSKSNVKYNKDFIFISPLYIGAGLNQTEFKKLNPEIVFKIVNDSEHNLNTLLPEGTVRFYENDGFGNVVFLGESQISQTALGEKLELKIGKATDFYSNGKIVDVKQIAKDVVEAEMEITFYNSKKTDGEVSFEQGFGGKWEIIAENIKGIKKNASTSEWQIKLPANSKFVLNFKVRIKN